MPNTKFLPNVLLLNGAETFNRGPRSVFSAHPLLRNYPCTTLSNLPIFPSGRACVRPSNDNGPSISRLLPTQPQVVQNFSTGYNLSRLGKSRPLDLEAIIYAALTHRLTLLSRPPHARRHRQIAPNEVRVAMRKLIEI